MTLRMTEEEFAELQRRRGLTRCAAPSPSGVSVAHLRGSDLSGIAKENPPKFEYYDEVDAWDYAALGAQKVKRNKYGNVRTEIDGIVFDSKHEAEVWRELMLRVKAGELRCVLRQVKFDLPGGIRYVADFVAIAPDMTIEGVYDAKSEATKKNRVFINKKKQLKALWGIEIREV